MSDYELFLDESGGFRESSTDAEERALAQRRRRRFPSQLAGESPWRRAAAGDSPASWPVCWLPRAP